jgi:hypothetical protein
VRGEELVEQLPRGGNLDRLAQLLAGSPHLALAEGELLPALLQRVGVMSAH